MNTLALLVVTLAVVQSASGRAMVGKNVYADAYATDEQLTPDFCRNYECPKFKVLQKFDGYELREYSPSVWASVEIPEMMENYWEHTWFRKAAFWKLFHYIQGENALEQEMNMTVPVVTSHAKHEVYMNFMIPSAFADKPPSPTGPNVTISNIGIGQYYVSSFGGWSYGFFGRSNHVKDEFLSLKQKLDNDGKSYQVDPMFITAVYNGPWDIFGRHNEVWIMKM